MRKVCTVALLLCLSSFALAQRASYDSVRLGGVCDFLTGAGSPEGVIVGTVCDVYARTDGGAGTTLYIKETGTGNTGWVPVGAVSGIVPVPNGGTGVATLAAHGVVIGNAAGVVAVSGAGTAGQVLTSNGAAADPTFQAAGAGSVTATAGALTNRAVMLGAGGTDTRVVAGLGTAGYVLTSNGAAADPTFQVLTGTGTVTATAGALTLNRIMLGAATTDSKVLGSLGTATTLLHGNASGAPSFGAVALTTDVSGLLPVANGGIGVGTLTSHGVVIGSGTAAVTATTAGTAGQVLTSNGASLDPTFQPLPAQGITITDVQSAVHATATTYALPAFAANPSNGDTIVVGYGIYDSTVKTAPAIPTDSAGNTYVLIGSSPIPGSGWNQKVYLYYAKNVVGGASFVVTANPGVGSSPSSAVAWSLTGIDPDPYNADVKSSSFGFGGASTGNSTPAPAATSMFIAMGTAGSSAVLTTAAGWNTVGANGFTSGMATRSASALPGGGNVALITEYKVSSTVENASWGNPCNCSWTGIEASFKPATLTARAVVLGAGGTSTRVVSGLGTAGQLLTSNGASLDPTYQTPAFHVGPATSTLTITSNTIVPTGTLHHVGAGLISTITVPALCTPTCLIMIVPDAAYTYDAAGNIALPSGGGTATIDRLMIFAWDGTKWRPSY